MTDQYAVNSSNVIQVTDVAVDGVGTDLASVSCTITDSTGTALGGVTWPQTLSSDGVGTHSYSVTLPSGAGFVVNGHYTLTVTIVVGALQLSLSRKGVGIQLS